MNPHLIVAVLALVGILALCSMALARRRAPEEKGQHPIYEVVCSGQFGRYGLLGVSIPCIRLSIYPSFIVICFLRPLVVPLSELACFESRGSWLLRHLYIALKSGRVWRLSIQNAEKTSQLVHTPNNASKPTL